MSVIDNSSQTLQNALSNALETTDRVDIATGFFYFSGFQTLMEELKDKKLRILIGLEVDPALIPQISQYSKEDDEDLTRWQPRRQTTSRTGLQENYIKSLVGFVNDSDIFDSQKSVEAYDIYRKKIEDGSLEIRKTISDHHAKLYLLHNREKFSQNGDFPGTVFMGSSNFTYNGLVGQGELNDSSREKQRFIEYQKVFDDLWSTSKSVNIVDKHTKDDFLKTLNQKLWTHATPAPYEIYIRILHEMFSQEKEVGLLTPAKITKGIYSDFEYQIDAVKMALDKIEKYDGVILADVVGLGKSIIASSIARNLDMKTVIISPPHLIPQWEDYKEEFGIRGSKVFSSGKIVDVYEKYQETPDPILLVIDEAHRYRNEDTDDYKLLHQVSRGHPENKIVLLTATPFNNDPKDVFALIKLFQTPGQSTIRSIDNLSLRYRELIQRYKKLRSDMAKGLGQKEVDKEAQEIAIEQRRLIESVIIRRSRIDLDYITRYKEDLKQQGISFAKIKGGGPELLNYDLGKLSDLYVNTLNIITDEKGGFVGARYQPTAYIQGENRNKFIKKFKNQIDDASDLWVAQSNLAKFMRRLLVMRFESSREAFRSTLDKMIESNKRIENWWDNLEKVPIMKKGKLPDPKDYDLEDGVESDALETELVFLRKKEGFLEVPKNLLDPEFIETVKNDTKILQKIYDDWYSDTSLSDFDPKLEEVKNRLHKFLENDPNKKIVIFSTYKDTVDYLYKKLEKDFKIFKYSASESNTNTREIVKNNFDASVPESKQENNFEILITTDALSEGYNLHRAGIIINYDIPYNPTRVIQRVGRINRINKRVFDFLEVYNCFPTDIGEQEVRVKSISTLKMKLINSIVGSDTRTLTPDEELVSYFKDEYSKAEKESEQLSWDAPHRQEYDLVKKDKILMEKISKLPRRARIKRNNKKNFAVSVFGKKGDHAIFTLGNSTDLPRVVSVEEALKYFVSKKDEKGEQVDDNFIGSFNLAKDKLFAKHELPKIQGRRATAIMSLKTIGKALPQAKDYCEDIINTIKQLDDISDGVLKDLSQLDLRNVEEAYKRVLLLVPKHLIQSIQERANRFEGEKELLLFAEQFE